MLGLEVEQLTGRSTPSSPSPSHSPAITNGSSRRTFSYSKLPEDTLNLSIRRLDGSSFDVEVLKSATVADLKVGVQNVFSQMPNDGPQKISWAHVWGHFCLSYCEQKLIDDTDHIIKYGIKDADQLQFIRHVSTCTNSPKIRKTRRAISQNHSYMQLSSSLEDELNDEDDDEYYHEVQKEGLWSSCLFDSPGKKRTGSSKNRGCRSTYVFL